MEGGIGILLLLIILVVAVVLGVALYLTGGALTLRRTSDEGEAETAERPRFKRVDQPPEEHVTLAGTEAGEREHRERAGD